MELCSREVISRQLGDSQPEIFFFRNEIFRQSVRKCQALGKESSVSGKNRRGVRLEIVWRSGKNRKGIRIVTG